MIFVYYFLSLSFCLCSFNSSETCSFSADSIISVDFDDNCCLKLQNCHVGSCYSILDKTYNLKWSNIVGINRSIFSDIYSSGTSFEERTPYGFFFVPSTIEVTICYTIQSKSNFIAIHQYEKLYDSSLLNITNIIRGLPLCPK